LTYASEQLRGQPAVASFILCGDSMPLKAALDLLRQLDGIAQAVAQNSLPTQLLQVPERLV